MVFFVSFFCQVFLDFGVLLLVNRICWISLPKMAQDSRPYHKTQLTFRLAKSMKAKHILSTLKACEVAGCSLSHSDLRLMGLRFKRSSHGRAKSPGTSRKGSAPEGS